MGEVIDENGIAPHIRYHHTIHSAGWSSEDNLWRLEGTRTDTGETVRISAYRQVTPVALIFGSYT